MGVKHLPHFYKKQDYAQRKQNASFANGLMKYSEIIDNKNGQYNVQTLDVNLGRLKSKNWYIDQSFDFIITVIFF